MLQHNKKLFTIPTCVHNNVYLQQLLSLPALLSNTIFPR